MSLFIIFPVMFLVGSVLVAVKAINGGSKLRKALALQIATFAVACVACLAIPMVAHAQTNEIPAANPTSTSQTTNDNAKGLGLLAAGICTGVAGIGGGIAVGGAATAAIGATSEDSKNFGKSLIFVALGEGIAIYGLLVSILILSRV